MSETKPTSAKVKLGGLIIYGLVLSATALYMVYTNLLLITSEGVNEQILIILAISGGALLGTLRVVKELVEDAAKDRFNPSYTLVFLWRPWEAVMVAATVYVLARGGYLVFNVSVSTTNGLGILVPTVLGGGFAHETLKRLYKKVSGNGG